MLYPLDQIFSLGLKAPHFKWDLNHLIGAHDGSHSLSPPLNQGTPPCLLRLEVPHILQAEWYATRIPRCLIINKITWQLGFIPEFISTFINSQKQTQNILNVSTVVYWGVTPCRWLWRFQRNILPISSLLESKMGWVIYTGCTETFLWVPVAQSV